MIGQVSAQEDNLDQLIKQHEQSGLPDLVVEPSAWQEKMEQLFQTWVEPIIQWLRSWFNGLNKINNQYQLPWKAIILGSLLILLMIGLFMLVRYFFKKKQSFLQLIHDDPMPMQRQSLYAAYVQAEQKGEYALAARLYWKCFLQEKNISLSKTPLEYFGYKDMVKEIYTLMFLSPAQKKDFEQFKESLNRSNDEK
ncbi:MAG TPA: hypothetical protein PKC21_03170 [Oligoflexia bacterium]|nr:hypothetical protein [Oligoflexia bacterium]HMR24335.1 hypothetical protein [Oligoflexia bacterium]